MKQSVLLALAVLATLSLAAAVLIDAAASVVAEIAVQGGWAPVGKYRPFSDPDCSNSTARENAEEQKPDSHPGDLSVPLGLAVEDRKTDREDKTHSP